MAQRGVDPIQPTTDDSQIRFEHLLMKCRCTNSHCHDHDDNDHDNNDFETHVQPSSQQMHTLFFVCMTITPDAFMMLDRVASVCTEDW